MSPHSMCPRGWHRLLMLLPHPCTELDPSASPLHWTLDHPASPLHWTHDPSASPLHWTLNPSASPLQHHCHSQLLKLPELTGTWMQQRYSIHFLKYENFGFFWVHLATRCHIQEILEVHNDDLRQHRLPQYECSLALASSESKSWHTIKRLTT